MNTLFYNHDEVKAESKHDQDKFSDMSSVTQLKGFEYRFVRFILNPATNSFQELRLWQDFRWSNLSSCHSGLSSQEYTERLQLFGPNVIEIPKKSIPKLLFDEILNPFYCFQIFSIILWCCEDYYYYAGCIFVISVFSITTTLIDTKKNLRKMRKMARCVVPVNVYRNRKWQMIDSDFLVPGDIFEVNSEDYNVFPCDSLLLQGDCVINESMLTGESIPVSKVPISDMDIVFEEFGPRMNASGIFSPELSKSLLFSGTHIVRIRPGPLPANVHPDRNIEKKQAIAMVIRSGYNTTKGNLVRSILYPRPNLFKFYRDSFYFVAMLFGVALIGFFISLWQFLSLGVGWHQIVLKALDLITIVVPPALPATMSIGLSFAISRLKKADIFCISPSRVNVCGKVDIMCFDKTGTLTEDGLDVLGVHDIKNSLFENLETKPFTIDDPENHSPIDLMYAFATCHSIKNVNGTLMGDPLDLKMFEFTQWNLDEGEKDSDDTSNHGPSIIVRPPHTPRYSMDYSLSSALPKDYTEIKVLNTFEFVSSLRRMSVVAQRYKSSSYEVFLKGAPEIMTAPLCRPETLPSNYHELVASYTHQGYRVIALAGKSLESIDVNNLGKAKRTEYESDLTFLGLIVFENKLKEMTTSSIKTLADANIRQVMCTGDNHLTAISVAKQCGIVDEKAIVFVPKIIDATNNHTADKVIWESIDDASTRLDSVTLRPSENLINNYTLAVTGDAFRWIMDFSEETVINEMLSKGTVYARMSPDEKQELVEKLQQLDYTVGFCGDGANDCGALKAADMGISLSEAEASVAAPFTSRITDIRCVSKVIREGRAALVTSFSCFKYMALYSVIQFTSIIILYVYGSGLGDLQFLWFDLFTIIPLAVFMGRTEANAKIHKKSPTANLMSARVVSSFIGQTIIVIIFQACAWVYIHTKPWYEKPAFDPDDKNIENFDNTTLFLVSSFQYVFLAVVFSLGARHRRSMFTNYPFMATVVILLVIAVVLSFGGFEWANNAFQLVTLGAEMHYIIIIYAAINFVTVLIYEFYGVELIHSIAKKANRRLKARKAKGYKLAKTSSPVMSERELSSDEEDTYLGNKHDGYR
jgi:cation-transporting ATPase 13A3/4/5